MTCESEYMYFCLTCGVMGVFVGLVLAGLAILVTDLRRAGK